MKQVLQHSPRHHPTKPCAGCCYETQGLEGHVELWNGNWQPNEGNYIPRRSRENLQYWALETSKRLIE
eukprot:scaffold1827_cov421-Prasinococcus_capsulatus_cf.AAC.46